MSPITSVREATDERITPRIAEVTTLHVRERSVADLASADGALVISTVLESRVVREVTGIASYDPTGSRITDIARALREACLTAGPEAAREVPA